MKPEPTPMNYKIECDTSALKDIKREAQEATEDIENLSESIEEAVELTEQLRPCFTIRNSSHCTFNISINKEA